jgi:hypothetical protein
MTSVLSAVLTAPANPRQINVPHIAKYHGRLRLIWEMVPIDSTQRLFDTDPGFLNKWALLAPTVVAILRKSGIPETLKQCLPNRYFSTMLVVEHPEILERILL